MTESEAIEILDGMRKEVRLDTAKGEAAQTRKEMLELMGIATKALEEIQQYRAIGTVEECRKAVERQKPVKLCGRGGMPVHIGDTVSGFCPICKKEFVCITPIMYRAKGFGYCDACGQKIELRGE